MGAQSKIEWTTDATWNPIRARRISVHGPSASVGWHCEPMLGPIDLHSKTCRDTGSCPACPQCLGGLDWVICGGESGHNARPMHPEWARALRDQCAAANVPFFFKQWGTFAPVGYVDRGSATDENEFAWERVGKKRAGRLLDGIEHNGMPGND